MKTFFTFFFLICCVFGYSLDVTINPKHFNCGSTTVNGITRCSFDGTLDVEVVGNPSEILITDISPVVNGSFTFVVTILGGAPANATLKFTLLTMDPAFDCPPPPQEDTENITTNCACNLSAFVNYHHESCWSCQDGSATVGHSGGYEPVEYLWSTGETGNLVENLAPGNYSVTVSDLHSCTVIHLFTIEEYLCSSFIVESEVVNPDCHFDCNGSILIDGISNGSSDYTILWADGDTSAFRQNLCPDFYSLTITDYDNCAESFTFQVVQPLLLELEMTLNHETCWNCQNGSASVLVLGGTGLLEILWSNGVYGIHSGPLASGTHSLTVTDSHGCSVTETFTINAYICTPFTVNAVVEHAGCDNDCSGSIQITGLSNGSTDYSVFWSNGQNTALIEDLCAGTYFGFITDSDNCGDTLIIAIQQVSTLELSLDIQSESCFGCNNGSATANVTGATEPVQIIWSNGASGIEVSDLEPGMYFVIVTDANNCVASDTVIIHPYVCMPFTIDLEVADAICHNECNGTIEILGLSNGSTDFTAAWTNGQSGALLEGVCAGSYGLIVTDSDNCSERTSVLVFQPEPVEITIDSIHNATSDSDGQVFFSVSPEAVVMDPICEVCDYQGNCVPCNEFFDNTSSAGDLTSGLYFIRLSFDNGCVVQSEDFEVEMISSISNVFGQIPVLYPNPATDYLNIRMDDLSNTTFEIRNLMGQPIQTTQNPLIYVGNLNPGLYFVTILRGNSFVTLPFNVIR